MSRWKTVISSTVEEFARQDGIPPEHIHHMREHFRSLQDKQSPTQGRGVEHIRHYGDGSWYRQAIKDDPELAIYRSIFKRYNYHPEARQVSGLHGFLRLYGIFRRTDDLYEGRVAELIKQVDDK